MTHLTEKLSSPFIFFSLFCLFIVATLLWLVAGNGLKVTSSHRNQSLHASNITQLRHNSKLRGRLRIFLLPYRDEEGNFPIRPYTSEIVGQRDVTEYLFTATT